MGAEKLKSNALETKIKWLRKKRGGIMWRFPKNRGPIGPKKKTHGGCERGASYHQGAKAFPREVISGGREGLLGEDG